MGPVTQAMVSSTRTAGAVRTKVEAKRRPAC